MTTIEKPEPIVLDAPAKEVLLFKNGSRIVREGTITVPEGDNQVALKFLPDSLDSSSVKVSGKGQVAGRIKSMNIEKQYEQVTSKEDIEQKEKQLEAMREQDAILVRKIEFIQARKADLTKLRESYLVQFPFTLPEDKPIKFLLQTGSNEIAMPTPKTAIPEFIGNVDGLLDGVVEKQIKFNDELVALREKIDLLVRQLDQLRNKTGIKTYNMVVIDVSAKNEGEFTFKVEYVIHAGSWAPVYDVLLDDESEKVKIKVVAAVTNDTQEDWKDVDLTLSSADLRPVQVVEPQP